MFHRQRVAYLRPMGAMVPAIYVESADELFPRVDGSIPERNRRRRSDAETLGSDALIDHFNRSLCRNAR